MGQRKNNFSVYHHDDTCNKQEGQRDRGTEGHRNRGTDGTEKKINLRYIIMMIHAISKKGRGTEGQRDKGTETNFSVYHHDDTCKKGEGQRDKAISILFRTSKERGQMDKAISI
jgi:hypothetical protein